MFISEKMSADGVVWPKISASSTPNSTSGLIKVQVANIPELDEKQNFARLVERFLFHAQSKLKQKNRLKSVLWEKKKLLKLVFSLQDGIFLFLSHSEKEAVK